MNTNLDMFKIMHILYIYFIIYIIVSNVSFFRGKAVLSEERKNVFATGGGPFKEPTATSSDLPSSVLEFVRPIYSPLKNIDSDNSLIIPGMYLK